MPNVSIVLHMQECYERCLLEGFLHLSQQGLDLSSLGNGSSTWFSGDTFGSGDAVVAVPPPGHAAGAGAGAAQQGGSS